MRDNCRQVVPCAAIFFAALFLVGCREEMQPQAEAQPRPARVMRIADSNIVAGRAFPGQARSAREAMLSFRIAGRLQERRVKPGDPVKEGDILAVLDPAPYQSELDRATAGLQRARAAYASAAGQLDRDKQLMAKAVIARARFETSESAAKQAKADVVSSEAAEQRARLDLGYTELRAPFSGIISAAFAETFEEIKPQEAVMRLIDPAEIEMVVNVPESLISYVPHVVDIKATFDSYPGTEIPGEVSEVGTEPNETTRTYPVKVLLTPPAGVSLLPGMAGRLRGKAGPAIASKTQGVVIPVAAVFAADDAKGSFVWTVSEGDKTVHRREVTLGEPVIGGVAVSGLEPGSLIVTAGVNTLREGQAVRLLEPEGGAVP